MSTLTDVSAPVTDVIDTVLGVTPGDAIDAIRRSREVARTHAQATYDALFSPVSDAEISLGERYAVASFVLGLHGETPLSAVYDAGVPAELAPLVSAQIAAALRSGPFGIYREPGLASESEPGEAFLADEALGERLAAAFTHAALLVYRPRESSPQALEALQTAGWSDDGIVTLSQLVSFLAFQVRIVAGLSVLAANPAPAGSTANVTNEG